MSEQDIKRSNQSKRILEDEIFIEAVQKNSIRLKPRMVKQRSKKFRTKRKHFRYEENVRTCCDATTVCYGDW
jgi:hypothetical protein